MRILIDECLPVQLRHLFAGHDARTVVFMSWTSRRSGELLAAAEREGFDVFLTAGAGIAESHDIGRLSLALVVVPTNRRKMFDRLSETIREAVLTAKPGEVCVVPLHSAAPSPR